MYLPSLLPSLLLLFLLLLTTPADAGSYYSLTVYPTADCTGKHYTHYDNIEYGSSFDVYPPVKSYSLGWNLQNKDFLVFQSPVPELIAGKKGVAHHCHDLKDQVEDGITRATGWKFVIIHPWWLFSGGKIAIKGNSLRQKTVALSELLSNWTHAGPKPLGEDSKTWTRTLKEQEERDSAN
ncbi:MAG: hypothetical protein Q9170_005003 [Blastenia crenularia]